MNREGDGPVVAHPLPCKTALATECAFLLFAVIASTGGPADHSMPLAHELEQAFATRCPFAAPSGRGDRVTAGRDVRRRKGSRMFVYSRGLLGTVGTFFPGPRYRGAPHSPRPSLCLREPPGSAHLPGRSPPPGLFVSTLAE